MSIDTTDVRDLINNPEGRTPYPEDNKVMLGSTPSGGISDEQLQSILDRLTALEGASDDYKLKVSPINYMGDDIRVQLRDNKSSTTLGDVLELSGCRVKKSASSPYQFQVPKPVSFVIDNTNLDAVPEFQTISESNFLKSSEFGYQSGAWQIKWKKTRTPLTIWHKGNSWSEQHGSYDEHNSVLLKATLGASADGSTHQLDAMYFFTNLFNGFFNLMIKQPVVGDTDIIVKFSILDLGGNFMSLTDAVKDKYSRQIVITKDRNSNYSSYITSVLGSEFSGALGNYGIHIEWDKKIIGDNTSDYDRLSDGD